jgi:hypothetical protein
MNVFFEKLWIKVSIQIILGLTILFFLIIGLDGKNIIFFNGHTNIQTQKMDLEDFTENLKDFRVENNKFTSTSDNSWIDLHFVKNVQLNKLVVNIEEMNVDATHGKIFYSSNSDEINDENALDFDLIKGTNTIPFPSDTKIKAMRVKLADKANVSISIESMTLKNVDKPIEFTWNIFLVVSILYSIFIFGINIKSISKKDNIVDIDFNTYGNIGTDNERADISSFFMPVLCSIGVSSIIIAIFYPIIRRCLKNIMIL